jgi:parallel beta-helix repeat protein
MQPIIRSASVSFTIRTIAPIALAMFAGLAVAGPINPPAGPVTSTMKTLSEVEPRIAINATNTPGDADVTPSMFKITQPGSYYLTGNITGVAGKNGIEITSPGVTIDLNGFSLNGVTGTLDGIVLLGNLRGTTIRNGVVSNWGGDGIDTYVGFGGGRIEGVISTSNGGDGIRAGIAMTVTTSAATKNQGDGIVTSESCTVIGCTAYSNTGTGFVVGPGSTVENCSSMGNDGRGFSAELGSTVRGCAATVNGSDGISCSLSCTIQNNTLSRNGVLLTNGAGIYVTGNDNRIEGNNCSGADIGLDIAASGNIIMKNTCSGNTSNWSIVAGNAVAPIVNAATNAAGINGNSYTGSLGSTDPNANFTY